VEIFSRVLKQYGVSSGSIDQEVEEVRKEGYAILRSTSLPTVETRLPPRPVIKGDLEEMVNP
jgi:hypothetical protein